ncbi:MAG: Zn-ribbon domain-containing OB-fold protein [Chloroflexi bacterium]|nr:Zn-ribbon domain-containing OB-fold protein [Chloroflexota bacterium]
MADAPRKLLPRPTPETQDFWNGMKAGELRLQRCNEPGCEKVYFPPRPFCPGCASRNVSSFRASGRGTLHSYIINHRPAPGFQDEAPYAIAVIQLDEGPRMMTNMVGVAQTPEKLVLDMPVELAPEKVTDEITLPKFRPAGGAR